MKRSYLVLLPVLLVVAAVIFGAGFDSATVGKPTEVTISSTGNTVTIDSTTNTIKDGAFTTITSTYGLASTTAVAVTALSGRDYIEFSIASSTPAMSVFVSVSTTTATVQGTNCFEVSYGCPLRIKAPATVAFGTIASSAVPFNILQAAY